MEGNMRIKKLETFSNEFVCFVKASTEDGQFGWGQTSTYNADITAQIFHRQVAPYVLGEDANDIPALIAKVERKEHKYPGSYRCRALAGLDTALWDWAGRKSGKPVVELLGGTIGAIRVYASSMRRDITPHDEALRFVKLRDKFGYDAFKWRVGSECGQDADEWQGRTEEVVPVVSKALGDGIAKLVDGNSCYSPKKAIAVGKLLIDNGIAHFEEPCPYWEFDQTRQVREYFNHTNLDITGGEQDCAMIIWDTMIRDKIVDIVQPDVMYMGGICQTLRVAQKAQLAGFPCTPHAANLSLVTICTAHLLKAIPNAGKYLEFSIEDESYYPWQQELFLGDPYKITDGKLMISNKPGWGVEINPRWLDKAQYQISESP